MFLGTGRMPSNTVIVIVGFCDSSIRGQRSLYVVRALAKRHTYEDEIAKLKFPLGVVWVCRLNGGVLELFTAANVTPWAISCYMVKVLYMMTWILLHGSALTVQQKKTSTFRV